MFLAWLLLLIAGLFEITWAIGLKGTEGLSAKPWLSLGTIAASVASFLLLAQAIKKGLPIGTGYAVWTGIGAVGSTLLGIMLFRESDSPVRLACIALIVVGIVGLKLTGQ